MFALFFTLFKVRRFLRQKRIFLQRQASLFTNEIKQTMK